MSLLMLGFGTSCTPEKKTAAVVESPSTEEDPAVANSYLYVQIAKRFYDKSDTGEYSVHDTCSIDSTLTPTANCTVTIPEAELFFSDLKFVVGGNVATCPILHFVPYMYQRSNSAAYVAPGETATTDCTATPVPAVCYGGAAPAIFQKLSEEFPKFTSFYHLTANSSSYSYPLPAEVATQWYSAGVNYAATNDLATGARAVTIAGPASNERVGGTYRDYTISCEDYWGATLFQINLTIEDEDIDETSTDPANDEYPDWN